MPPGFIQILIILPVSCIAAYGLARWLTGLSMQWALRHGVVSHVTHRSSHSVPTARLGGVGLALGFGLASLLLIVITMAFSGKPAADLSIGAQPYLFLFLGWLAMLVIGLLDDLWDLPALIKLILTILGSAVPVIGSYLGGVHDGGAGPLAFITGWMMIGIWSFWILFFVNAFNFMDGMDGFAASFARLSAIFFFIVMVPRAGLDLHDSTFACMLPLLLPVLATACRGFLHWNRPPARVFMGDGGSLSLGYLLAVYVFAGDHVRMSNSTESVLPALTGLTILLPFTFDVVLTLIRRSLRGENILKAHREHLYQRLMKTGLSHAEVLRINTLRFWIINIAAVVGALPAHPVARWAAFLFALVVMLHYWRMVLSREKLSRMVSH